MQQNTLQFRLSLNWCSLFIVAQKKIKEVISRNSSFFRIVGHVKINWKLSKQIKTKYKVGGSCYTASCSNITPCKMLN
jgi:hypothetical protein